ncbi:MAG: hypothetical protein M1838_004889 [Thelocarpon superellum]|nr:MAG: hypothetical protein M1838_004889 [Thelocarpon superellum]
MSATDSITLEYQGRVAVITLCNEKKLNALSPDLYYHIANLLREISTHDEVYVTLFIGKGRFFSAGADVTGGRGVPAGEDERRYWLRAFSANNLDVTRAFYTHPKILVTGLNGPVVGLTAALIAMSDFIYAMPHTFLLTPFSSLGLVTEGGASYSFVQRLGISKANEALIMSKRITASELAQAGFVNKVIDTGNDDVKFREAVMHEIHDRLGDHLNSASLLKIKALIRKPEREVLETQNVAEVFGGLERFAAGIPQEEFRKIASGEKRHKL